MGQEDTPGKDATFTGRIARIAARDDIWRAPLVPVALSLSTGIVIDRSFGVPILASLIASFICLAAWILNRKNVQIAIPLLYLAAACGAMGAAFHHWRHDVYPADDIGNFASNEPRPVVIRGWIDEEPATRPPPEYDPLKSFRTGASTTAVVRVAGVKEDNDWKPASGRARLTVADSLQDVHVGDSIEIAGRLVQPASPANPGEFDVAAYLQDQRIRAEIQARRTAAAVVRLAKGWSSTWRGWLAIVRGWGERTLQENLPPQTSNISSALLLGDSSSMTYDDWDKYVRTGVVHVLAISGHHLTVLAFLLWWLVKLSGMRRRRAAWLVGAILLAYALLTGGRPPIMRAAIMVGIACGGIILRRPIMSANSLALALILVIAVNPTDLFSTGCQHTFLSVAIIYWGMSRWFRRPVDPLERLIDEARPAWQRIIRKVGAEAGIAYAVTVILTIAMYPLIAGRYHLISLAALVIGPPVILLVTVALFCGFILIPVASVSVTLAIPFARLVDWSLIACEWLVEKADRFPGSHWYVPDIPEWWLWGFYTGLLSFLTIPALANYRRLGALCGLGWFCLGIVVYLARPTPDELRCTFLAVGHGGCAVLETPDGRVLLYDAGSISGPDVTRRQIAPFLWSRGIRRIDEIFLSHADLDHFNGLPALVERFAVGQVTCTPTFSEKSTAGVPFTLAALDREGIPRRTVRAGDRLTSGPVEIEVVHPPEVGPEGNENSRSMVLVVRDCQHTFLLTGDLEGEGLQRVLGMKPPHIDVLMAPHHGSRISNTPAVAAWAKPKVVVSCEGVPRGFLRSPEPYTQTGARFFATWPNGAITIRSHSTGLVIETFRSKERLVVR
jgi:competence protein ComEC